VTPSASSYALAFSLFLLGGLVWEGYQIVLWRLVRRPSSHVVWPTDLGGLTRVLVGILGLMFVAGGIWQFATASSGSEYLMGAAVAMFGVVGAVAAFRGKSPSWLAEESIPTVNEPTRSRSDHHGN